MRLPLDLFLALRYLKPKRTFLSVISLLSVLGPLLGVAILIIVTAIMAGFEHNIKAGIMNMQAHVTVYPTHPSGAFTDPATIIQALETEGKAQHLRATPVIEGTALVQLRDTVYPKIVRGIDPDSEARATNIQAKFDPRGFRLAEKQAILGYSLADHLRLHLGSQFLIHSPARLTSNISWRKDGKVEVREPDELYLPEECTVAGFYTMGVSDYDDNIIILHIDQAAQLFGIDWGTATSIQAVVDNPMDLHRLATDIRTRHPEWHVITWQEKNKLLFDTLQNEKTLMSFLMTFIVLVASFAIAATLITVVVQKTREIGILKAVGVSSPAIARIFLLQGAIIGSLGTALGTAAGLLVIHYRDAIARILSRILGHEIFPAQLYHLTSIPARVFPADLVRIILSSLVICIFAALIPALYASAFSPAQSLRSDD